MENNNWVKWGDEIKDAVQSSIDSKDFSNLNEVVGKIVDGAVDGIKQVANKNVQQNRGQTGQQNRQQNYNQNQTANQGGQQTWNGQQNQSQNQNQSTNHSWQNAQQQWKENWKQRQAEQPIWKQNWEKSKRQNTQSVQKSESHTVPKIYGTTTGTTVAGLFMAIFGGCATAGLSLAVMSVLITMMILESATVGGIVSGVILGGLLGGAITLLVKGIGKVKLVSRFQRYIREIGNKTYIPIKELSDRTGQSINAVKKDLRLMIKKEFFLQGHIDEQDTCLMVNNTVYEHYLEARKQYALQQQEKEKQEAEQEKKQEKDSNLPENVRQIITSGEEYIQKIRHCNNRIAGEEISGKISRMEAIVQKIFQRVRQKPELVGDMKKMMDYYLPTTVKLLDAYAELDAQPVQGPNITSSKTEIEKTLDTLNAAFENLLDGFYRDTAWDISSDISVLETMLAQEGLTTSEFDKMKEPEQV